jgi:hypothetical protein
VTSRVQLRVCGAQWKGATVAELCGGASKKERLAFMSGEMPQTVPANRVVRAPVTPLQGGLVGAQIRWLRVFA